MISPTNQKFILDGSRFVVTEKNDKYGKVTGTYMAGLLGKSKWTTPFVATAKMLRIFDEDIGDKKEVHAGHVLEPKILDYVGALHGDEIFGERRGNHEEWESDFDDPVFGGHIDGMMPDGTIVEVKTTKNPEDWVDGVPEYYWIQASLYAHFLKSDKIMFLVGFTDEKSLSDPDSWEPNERTVARFDVPIIKGFDEMLEQAKEIYEDTVLQNRTAEMMPNPMDRRVGNLVHSQIWTYDDVQGAIADLRTSQKILDGYKAVEKGIQDQKDALMLYLKAHKTETVSDDISTVKITSYNRHSIDSDALKRDGLYENYLKETTVESIRIGKKR